MKKTTTLQILLIFSSCLLSAMEPRTMLIHRALHALADKHSKAKLSSKEIVKEYRTFSDDTASHFVDYCLNQNLYTSSIAIDLIDILGMQDRPIYSKAVNNSITSYLSQHIAELLKNAEDPAIFQKIADEISKMLPWVRKEILIRVLFDETISRLVRLSFIEQFGDCHLSSRKYFYDFVHGESLFSKYPENSQFYDPNSIFKNCKTFAEFLSKKIMRIIHTNINGTPKQSKESQSYALECCVLISELLKGNKASLNSLVEGKTLLNHAVRAAYGIDGLNVVKNFINQGFNVNDSSIDFFEPGHTPLHVCRLDQVAEALIEVGADINARGHSDMTPLHTAVKNLDLMICNRGWQIPYDCFKTILNAKNVNINLQDINGDTPLNLASRESHLVAVEALVAKNADRTLKNFYGHTPLETAQRALSRCIEYANNFPEMLCYSEEAARLQEIIKVLS